MINEGENDGQKRCIRISILNNDFCLIMKQNKNDLVSKYYKYDELYPNQQDVSPVYGFFKCQEKIEIKLLILVFNIGHLKLTNTAIYIFGI